MATRSSRTQWKLVPHLDWNKISAPEHFVLFYDTDKFLLDSLIGFIGMGLDVGDVCIVIATKVHQESLEKQLQAKGLELAAARTQGDYISLDADETLSNFMFGGLPEPRLFAEVIGNIITQAAKKQRHIRVFGEMAALLWKEGNQTASSQLKELWNNLLRTAYPFTLLCGHEMHDFAGDIYKIEFTEICQPYSLCTSDQSTTLTSADEHLDAISQLQQKVNLLQAEIAEERKEAEARLRIAESRYRRLFETSRDGILIIDPSAYTIVDANPCMTELLGYTREQLLGQEMWQIGLFQDRQTTLEALQELQENHSLCYECLPLCDKDGQYIYIELIANIYQENEHPIIQCNIRDITVRKRKDTQWSCGESGLNKSSMKLKMSMIGRLFNW
jgi:PAS domain S-box-containing protein